MNPTPPDEQPRYFTIFDLIRHWLVIGPTCGGFYLGLRLSDRFEFGGCWCGFAVATVAYFAVLVFFAEMSRRAEKEGTPPSDDPPTLE